MFRITVRDIWANRKATLLGSTSIIACIAFITAVLIVSATVQHSFAGLFATSYANADVVVRSANKIEGEFGRDNRDEISDILLERVRSTAGVAEAIGAIEGKALISTLDGVSAQKDENLPEYGGIFIESALTPWRLTPGSRAPSGPTEVVIDRGSAAAADISIGQTIRVTTRVGAMRFTVVGVVAFASGESAGGATWALFDQPTAELVVSGGAGLLDEIRVRANGSVSDTELAARLKVALNSDHQPDTEVVTGAAVSEESQGALGKTVRLFTSLALLFAAIAMVSGSFVIAAVVATSAARRRTQHGLLRAVGATRRQVGASVLAEAAVLGIIGAGAGFAAGIGLAHLVGGLLASIGFALPPSRLVVRPSVLLIDVAVAICVSVAAASIATVRSSRLPPLVSIRAGAEDAPLHTRRRLIVVACGLAASGVSLIRANATTSAAWLLVSLVALPGTVICAGALVIGRVGRILSPSTTKRATAPRWIGARSLVGRPRRFALGTNVVMIAAALVIATSTIRSSADASLYDNFAGQINADLLISSTKPSQQIDGIFPQSLVTDIARLPQIEHATGVGYERFTILDGDGRQTKEVARVIDPSSVADLVDLDFVSGSLLTLTTNGVVLSEGKARRDGRAVGDVITATLLNGEVHELTVEGIFRRDDLTNQVLNVHLFDTQSKPVDYSLIVASAKPGAGGVGAAAALTRTVADHATGQVQTRRQFLASQSDQVATYLHVIDALVALSIFVAVVGVATMLMLAVNERSRELGLLRITGMTLGQLRRAIAWESLITCTAGALEGLAVGLFGGWAFVRVFHDRGLHHFALSPVDMTVVVAVAVGIGLVVSVWPARRAAMIDSLSEMAA